MKNDSIDELKNIEEILFAIELNFEPKIKKFKILVDNSDIFCYNIVNEFGKWRIITE